jgi:hypothetical protein
LGTPAGRQYLVYLRRYLDSHYLKDKIGAEGFYRLCALVGISPETVEANDENAGGAQYLIKQAKADFWDKLEQDAENIYMLLTEENARSGFCKTGKEKNQVQAWCADMWALWWNALLANKEFKIDPALDFCWSDSPPDRLQQASILHYTGRISRETKHIFRKENYILFDPFRDDLSAIDDSTCSQLVRDSIVSYQTRQKKQRPDLSDLSFLMLVRIDSADRMENVQATLAYLQHHFHAPILLLEADESPKMDAGLLDEQVTYLFVKDGNSKLHYTRYLNDLVRMAETPFVALYDTDIIIPEKQILESVNLLRRGNHAMISPYDGTFIHVDSLMKALFIRLQDTELFSANQGKLHPVVKRSYGGVVLVNRGDYLRAGMENEHLTSWGPNDIERIKRMEILGYGVKRVPGNLYHLQHQRGINSGYQTSEERHQFMGEYLKICGMRKNELEAYVDTWNWIKTNSLAYALQDG